MEKYYSYYQCYFLEEIFQQDKDLIVDINTTMGTMKVKLIKAPQTVSNFVIYKRLL